MRTDAELVALLLAEARAERALWEARRAPLKVHWAAFEALKAAEKARKAAAQERLDAEGQS